ncbi:hypothetical protein ACJMK2_032030 [Sinanodonta woodiana]|uniref:Fucolectin-related molecule n=1 Tax=Sinanodonta woodiana TaxID=1069815 RepID=A0ABD3X0I2_SINWO
MSSHLLFQIALSFFFYYGLGTLNFAQNKPAVQSSTSQYYFEWTADKAVDGNSNGSEPRKSMTCSATKYNGTVANHTWEVDIGFQIIVKTITVYGTDTYIDLLGFKLYIGNVSRPWIYNQDIPSNSSSKTIFVFKPNDAIASVISLKKEGQQLVICEVTVEGECLGGNFSEFCNLTCGACKAYQTCNQDNGSCSLGCDRGWKGTFCKEHCERGNYGYNCNETCGRCLYGNNSCSTSDGNCSNGCMAGWQGHQCKTGCIPGQYGHNCNETCGNCLNGNTSCDTSYGHCTNGCMAGWQGDDCKTDTLRTVTTADVGPDTGVIVGSVLAAVGVFISAMVIIIVVVKKRRMNHNNATSTDNVTTAAHNDAVCKITARNITKKDTTYSTIENASLHRGMRIGVTNTQSDVTERDVPVLNVYVKLQDVTESIESAYCTIDDNRINDHEIESMKIASSYVETLQSLESTLMSVDEEINVLLDKKEQILSKELESARANKLRDKWKQKDSGKDKGSNSVNCVQALQPIEGELRILEEKRKCILGRKEILLRQELAKTTDNEK